MALLIVINLRHDYALIAACALFGFSVGNLITLPALIVQREFDPRSFGVLVSLITAIDQVTYAFGPAWSACCAIFGKLAVAVLRLYGGAGGRGSADHGAWAAGGASAYGRSDCAAIS